jgi:hypothetical protein
LNPPTETHENNVPTRYYPDLQTAADAIHEFKTRVMAIADEMGIHCMMVVAQFCLVEEQPPAQCVVAYGCMPCGGVAAAQGISALMGDQLDFSKGYIAATLVEAKNMATGIAAMKKAQQEGYQA